jgi:UDP-N-acetylmuramate dehydrogenase
VSVAASLEALGLTPLIDEPLARHGFWRIGGPADVFVVVKTVAQLAGVMALSVPVTVLGNGSNLLIADAGIRGVVIRLKGEFLASTVVDGVVEVGGGLLNAALLARLSRQGLGGLGCLAGIPGTVGGAIRMNAGWRLGEIGAITRSVEAVLDGGEIVRYSPEDIGFVYRRAPGLPHGAVVTRAWLSVVEGEAVATEKAEIREYLGRRKATQPLDRPSCGSVFKNPPGDYAGRLIEVVGLKGHTIGGAQLSEKHANFIVNIGDATAADVYGLIKLARDTVLAETGMVIEPEVHAVGDWPQGAWPL